MRPSKPPVFPDFTLACYTRLLSNLKAHGRPVLCRDVPRGRSKRCFLLRHDVDFDLGPAEAMAAMEAEAGITAAYFVALTLRYNPMTRESRGVLRHIMGYGHEVGLHFDAQVYPQQGGEALRLLEREVPSVGLTAEPPPLAFVWAKRTSEVKDRERLTDCMVDSAGVPCLLGDQEPLQMSNTFLSTQAGFGGGFIMLLCLAKCEKLSGTIVS